MARRVPIPIPKRDAQAKAKFAGTQTLINCFVEPNREEGPALYGCAGFGSAFATFASGAVRGHGELGDVALVVAGTKLYTLTSAGTVTERGTVAGTLPVQVVSNGLQAIIIADAHAYYWDGTTFGTVTDADFAGEGGSADFIDQYIAYHVPNTGIWGISDLADVTDYDALDVVTAELRPDPIVRVVTDGREVLVFGKKTVEGNYNSGVGSFPFDRTPLSLEIGLTGRDALSQSNAGLFWIADDKTVRRMSGATPEVVSDPQTQAFIESWGDLSVTRSFKFMLRGHAMVAFRHANGCAVLDVSTGFWHRRKSHGSSTWRIVGAMEIWGKVILFDGTTGACYEQSADVHSEAGNTLSRQFWTATIGPGGSGFTLDAAILEIDTGVSDDAGVDVYMALSRDEGRSFGTSQVREMGDNADEHRQMVWNDGYGDFKPHGGVLMFGMDEAKEFVVTNAWADIEVNQ